MSNQADQKTMEAITGKKFDEQPSPLVRPAPSQSDVEAAWRDLLEKDDRTSPAEYPDMALITFDEFAAVARIRGAAVPEGWSIVPDEPTKEMRKAASDLETKSAAENYGGAPSAEEYWHAMISAAPEAPR